MCLYVARHMNTISAKEKGRSCGSHTSAVHDLSLLRCDAVSTFRRTSGFVFRVKKTLLALFLHRSWRYYSPSKRRVLTQRQGVICRKAWTVTANNFGILLNCFHKPVAVIQAWWLIRQYYVVPTGKLSIMIRKLRQWPTWCTLALFYDTSTTVLYMFRALHAHHQ